MDTKLSISDHNKVYLACKTVSASWDDLGSRLGVSQPTRATIWSNHKGDVDGCLSEVITKWLTRPKGEVADDVRPSWRSLCEALSFIDQNLADKIAEQHSVGTTGIKGAPCRPASNLSREQESKKAKDALQDKHIELKDAIVSGGVNNIVQSCFHKGLITAPVKSTILSKPTDDDKAFACLNSIRNSLIYNATDMLDKFLCIIFNDCGASGKGVSKDVANKCQNEQLDQNDQSENEVEQSGQNEQLGQNERSGQNEQSGGISVLDVDEPDDGSDWVDWNCDDVESPVFEMSSDHVTESSQEHVFISKKSRVKGGNHPDLCLALLITNTYKNTTKPLPQVENDRKELYATFCTDLFDDVRAEDVTKGEMADALREAIEMSESRRYKCVVVAFSGHGGKRSDGGTYIVSDDRKPICTWKFIKSIISKFGTTVPKVILIDACRGSKSMPEKGPGDNCLIAQATKLGYSVPLPATGSYWIIEVGKCFRELNSSISEVVQEANERVKKKTDKQEPEIEEDSLNSKNLSIYSSVCAKKRHVRTSEGKSEDSGALDQKPSGEGHAVIATKKVWSLHENTWMQNGVAAVVVGILAVVAMVLWYYKNEVVGFLSP